MPEQIFLHLKEALLDERWRQVSGNNEVSQLHAGWGKARDHSDLIVVDSGGWESRISMDSEETWEGEGVRELSKVRTGQYFLPIFPAMFAAVPALRICDLGTT